MSAIDHKSVLDSNLTVIAYETNLRRAKKLRVHLSNITQKAMICSDDFINTYKSNIADIVIFSLNDSSDIILLEEMYKVNINQVCAVLVDEASAQDYKRMIALNVNKFIIKPYVTKQLLDDIILLAHSKVLEQKSLQLVEQKVYQLEQIDKLKDSLLTLFTHELKTPLNAILNFSKHIYKVVSKSQIDSKEKVLYELKQVNINSKVIAELVENIISSMKIRIGDVDISREKINLYNFFYMIKEKYEVEASESEVTISIDSALSIYSDRECLRQIFSNLYTNAIKYGKGKIVISAKIVEKKFEISIEDNGVGLKYDEKLFELFEQSSSNVMQREDKGCGVGLYLVKEIVDILGYNIEINNSIALGGTKISIKGSIDND